MPAVLPAFVTDRPPPCMPLLYFFMQTLAARQAWAANPVQGVCQRLALLVFLLDADLSGGSVVLSTGVDGLVVEHFCAACGCGQSLVLLLLCSLGLQPRLCSLGLGCRHVHTSVGCNLVALSSVHRCVLGGERMRMQACCRWSGLVGLPWGFTTHMHGRNCWVVS